VVELSSYTAWWRRGAEVPVMASRWHAQRGSFRTHATVLIIWGNGTSLSKQIGHLKRELHVVHSRCSCTSIMSGISLPFLWCTYLLLDSWAWHINSVQWLWSPSPGEYSQVGHLMLLHPSQLLHSVCTNKTHSNFHSPLLLLLKKLLLWTDLIIHCLEHGLYSLSKK
jgi:hypothetical protein